MLNYNGKKFKPVSNTQNGETTAETVFEYRQNDNILSSEYSGGKIVIGYLIGKVDRLGIIDMRYQHINTDNEIMTGICQSTPEILPNGKMRLHEKWR